MAGAWRARSVRAAEPADQVFGPRQPCLAFFFAHGAAAAVRHDLVYLGPLITRPTCLGLLAERCPLDLLRQLFLPLFGLFGPFRLELVRAFSERLDFTLCRMKPALAISSK